MKQPIYTGQRCPVCGRPTIAIIDQVAGLPVTICINCDNTEAMKRFPRSTRWRISFQVWLLTTEAYGTWALLCTGLTMTALFVLMVGVEAGWRRLAVGAVGIACQVAVFLLYLRIMRLYLRGRQK